MAKEGSVAPKERVNIVYRPATGGAQTDVELPLKMFVMGDFTMRQDGTPLEERKPVRVDKDNFNDVLASHKLALNVNVANTLTGEKGAEMSVGLKFDSMKDFSPAEIAKQVPELQKLLELREAIQGLKATLNERDFSKKIEALIKDPAQREKILNELKLGGGE